MGRHVIEINNLGKQYRLGQVGTTTMSDDLKRWWYKVRGKEDPFLKVGEENDRSKKGNSNYVWALKDINFSVNQGEVLGIIGKNGAGKSTLLKILSRTTAPTLGEYKIKGRVASLLEVGTGFHPDLSGRENVFLNGAIMGMRKSEIARQMDAIVDFSGVERYLDTPVKRYSSGMYVRLAFAVAAHLDPEILIVDEVLAVGDQEFQDKCIGKMKDVSKSGRTVLFVSHNMNAVKTMCNTVLYLKNGTVKNSGPSAAIVDEYMFDGLETQSKRMFSPTEVNIGNYLKMNSVYITDKSGNPQSGFDVTESVYLTVEYSVLEKRYGFTTHFYIKNSQGDVLFVAMDNKYSPYAKSQQEVGDYKETVIINGNFFNEGNYTIDVLICSFPTTVESTFCISENALLFGVTDKNLETGTRGNWQREWPAAIVRPDFEWIVQKTS